MGSWGQGLLDNDAARDELGRILTRVFADLKKAAAAAKLTRNGTGELAAQLALLAHYERNLFEQKAKDAGYEKAKLIRDTVKKHRVPLDVVAPKGKAALDAIASGKALPEDMPVTGLLTATHARAYLQELADRAIEDLEDKLDQRSGAHLDLLRLIGRHVELPADRIKEWLEQLDEEGAADSETRKAFVRACKQLAVAAAASSD